MSVVYEDLFDLEKRPGAGVALWTNAVEVQLDRVREVNYRHRLAKSPNEDERREDPEAESHLHIEVYFLALAVRRVVLFHEALADQVDDPRLTAARAAFDEAAPSAKTLRDFYEHLNEYLLDAPTKHVKFAGRASPVLRSRWDADNVVVSFGPISVDVTLAAVAAIELGKASAAVWDEHLDRVKALNPPEELPPKDDDVHRVLEVTLGRSSIIGSADNPPEITTGVLLGVRVREATEDEARDSA